MYRILMNKHFSNQLNTKTLGFFNNIINLFGSKILNRVDSNESYYNNTQNDKITSPNTRIEKSTDYFVMNNSNDFFNEFVLDFSHNRDKQSIAIQETNNFQEDNNNNNNELFSDFHYDGVFDFKVNEVLINLKITNNNDYITISLLELHLSTWIGSWIYPIQKLYLDIQEIIIKHSDAQNSPILQLCPLSDGSNKDPTLTIYQSSYSGHNQYKTPITLLIHNNGFLRISLIVDDFFNLINRIIRSDSGPTIQEFQGSNTIQVS